MKITKISAYAVKAQQTYNPSGAVSRGVQLPGSEYFHLGDYPQLYSARSQAALIRVETDGGLVGWGESQAPIGTEVILTLVQQILAPALLGREVEATNLRYSDMYSTLRVRGQVGGFQLDAIAGLDTALWDIRGKILNRSIADLLGGRRRDRLPCYVTGLRAPTPEGRAEEAERWTKQGIGVKSCLGLGFQTDVPEVERLRAAVGGDGTILVDAFWNYSFAEAVRVGRAFEELDVGFLEAPLAPEDVHGHARLVDKLDLPIAIGEPIRHTSAFLPWFQQDALSIAQPDLMRNGITETVNISTVADAFQIPVALHSGCTTVVGMAATWQVAATLANFLVQEYQPVMLDTFNGWLEHPMGVKDGELVVPTGPGLGLTLDEQRIAAESTSVIEAAL